MKAGNSIPQLLNPAAGPECVFCNGLRWPELATVYPQAQLLLLPLANYWAFLACTLCSERISGSKSNCNYFLKLP